MQLLGEDVKIFDSLVKVWAEFFSVFVFLVRNNTLAGNSDWGAESTHVTDEFVPAIQELLGPGRTCTVCHETVDSHWPE